MLCEPGERRMRRRPCKAARRGSALGRARRSTGGAGRVSPCPSRPFGLIEAAPDRRHRRNAQPKHPPVARDAADKGSPRGSLCASVRGQAPCGNPVTVARTIGYPWQERATRRARLSCVMAAVRLLSGVKLPTPLQRAPSTPVRDKPLAVGVRPVSVTITLCWNHHPIMRLPRWR